MKGERAGKRGALRSHLGVGVALCVIVGWSRAEAQLLPIAPPTTTSSPAPAPARGPNGTKALALVIGVNRAPDRSLAELRYADDDAVRFGDLFRTAGVQTAVLATLDQNTRRLHPDAAAEAVPARLENVVTTVEALAAEADRARLAGLRVAFYFIYAGHGRVDPESDGGGGKIALEDAQLRGADILTHIIDKVRADENHVIVDACNSYFLVLGRGPGGRRRPIEGFAQFGILAERQDIGLLLSTSSARDSHEWAAFQAGVFSQEIRSGLYGPADANNDGLISYSEIGAFVAAANDAIRNERYRPELYSRAPTGPGYLLDLRKALARRIEVPPGGGHQFLEDTAGVRLADFHNGVPIRLVRPSDGRLYLRRTSDDREYVLPSKLPVVRTAELALQEPRSSARSAANDAFAALFSVPFGTDTPSDLLGGTAAIAEGEPAPPPGPPGIVSRAPVPAAPRLRPKTVVGVGLAALGAVSAVWGVTTLVEARRLRDRSLDASNADATQINEQITAKNRRALLLMGGGAALLAGGLVVLLWPDSPVTVSVSDSAIWGGLSGRF